MRVLGPLAKDREETLRRWALQKLLRRQEAPKIFKAVEPLINPGNSRVTISLSKQRALLMAGGAIMDLSVHDYDALNWVLGTPKTVYSRGKAAKPGLWNHALSLVDYGSMNGYVEGIALDVNGYVSEGSGENLFVVRQGKLITAPLGNSVLPGITRDSVLRIALDLEISHSDRKVRRVDDDRSIALCSTQKWRS